MCIRDSIKTMAIQLSGEEFETIRDSFLRIDKDGDGQLTKDELTEYFGTSNLERVDFTLQLMDLDRSGTIEFHEFIEMVAFLEFNKGVTEDKLRQFFKAMDVDGNGTLSAKELRRFYQNVIGLNALGPSQEDVEKLIASLDLNGDGNIDCEEFIQGFFQSQIQ